MKYKFLLLISLFVAVLPQNSSKKADSIEQIIQNNCLVQVTTQVEKIKAQILEKVGLNPKSFSEHKNKVWSNFKKEHQKKIDFYKKKFQAKKWKHNNVLLKEIQKQYPQIKFYIGKKIFEKIKTPAITVDYAIFIDEKYIDNLGSILHEIGHVIYEDCMITSILKCLTVEHKLNKELYGQIRELMRNFSREFEKRADFFAASFGQLYAQNLIDMFKKMPNADSKNHPPIASRIKYLENFKY